ncbi:hypothetical protein [Albibacterium profundi]|uniref:DUF5723 domain-containing protein n=1 Tax=Albibacterium profundi TaxID=3134906 RepID=A0ABV5CBJ6_9SPHI
MKSQLIAIAIGISLSLFSFIDTSFAQESDQTKGFMHNIHIGLIYPISNHGVHAGEYSNVLSVHGLAGLSKNERGFSMAGIANLIKEDAQGAQFAGILNQYHNAKGIQMAGLLNLAKGHVSGVQIAGLLNKAGTVDGVQFAGLMNIADSSDYPVGLVNIIKNGTMSIGLSVDDDQTILASFRSGGRVLYGIIGLGYNLQNGEQKYAFEGGIGAHLLSRGAFTLNMEVIGSGLIDFEGGMYNKNSLRLLPAYKLSESIEIYAGPVASHIFTNTEDGKEMIKNTIWKKSLSDGEMSAVNIGFIGGIQIYL